MIDQKKIIAAAERRLAGSDMFVVGCNCSPGNETEFHRDAEDFSLTVASAGIGSELRCLRQYRKLVGRPVEVLLASGVKITARLDEVDDESLTLSYEEKQAVEGRRRKQLVRVTRRYPFAEVKSTREYLDFK